MSEICLSNNNMLSARTIATFAIPLIILGSASLSTMPARATKMNVYVYLQNFSPCVGANSNLNTWLYQNAGPASSTWVVSLSIRLNGGDNTQYTNWVFTLYDGSDNGNLMLAQYWDGEIHYVSQGELFGSTMTASFADPMSLALGISNADSVSQCYAVQVTAWYY
jgi:hypothetical protein